MAYKKIVSCAGPLRLDAASTPPLRDEVDSILMDNLVLLRRNHVQPVIVIRSERGADRLLGIAHPSRRRRGRDLCIGLAIVKTK